MSILKKIICTLFIIISSPLWIPLVIFIIISRSVSEYRSFNISKKMPHCCPYCKKDMTFKYVHKNKKFRAEYFQDLDLISTYLLKCPFCKEKLQVCQWGGEYMLCDMEAII